MCDAKGAHDQSNIDPGNRCGGSDHRWLRNESSRRNDLAVSCHSEGLPSVVGNLAVDSWSGERQTGARKRDSKYDSDNRSQHVPISKGERRRHSPRWALYGQSKYATQRSGLDCRRWTEGWSINARHLRDHRRDPQTRLLGADRRPASHRVHVDPGKPPNPSILDKNRSSAFAVGIRALDNKTSR